MIEFKQDGKAEIILMGRIKYQEAIGLEVKRGRPPAGLAPRQLILDKGKDLNEFYQLTRGGIE